MLLLLSLYILFRALKDYYLPKLKGRLGEYRVSRRLRRLNKRDYLVYNNVYLKEGARTTQIDHIVLSVYGIFVIETKNHKGWIFGNDRSKYWTQTLYSRKFKIYNPVIQNWTHVNFLKRISQEFRTSTFFPVVVFSGRATLKKIDTSLPVIKKRKLLRTIKREDKVLISHRELQALDNILKKSIASGSSVRRQHRRNVSKTKSNKQVEITTCPRCGGNLAVKQGRHGWFKGCSNYPNCRFTRNVK